MINKYSFLSVPHECYIILTSDCNQRCLHCYGDFGERKLNKQLTAEEWKKIFKDLSDSGVFYLNISGGEPTVHKEFIEIINYLNEINFHFILTTNGLLNKEAKNAILKCKDVLIGVKISIDGSNAESHCFLRRDLNGNKNNKLFYKTIETIEWMNKNDIPFTIATCIHNENIKEIEQLSDLVIKWKPNSWYISSISSSGRASSNADIIEPKDINFDSINWKSITQKCNDNSIFLNIIDIETSDMESDNGFLYYNCPAARSFCEISSDGIVTPCPLSDNEKNRKYFNFDSIIDNSIKDIWNGKVFNKFRELQSQGCNGCISLEKCTRCIPQSISHFDNPLLPTPYCIQKSKILNLKNETYLKSLLDI